MNDSIEKSILNQMWIYTAALKTILFLKLTDKYAAQFDQTIDNLQTSAHMLLMETRRQEKELKMSVNVKA